MLVPVLDAVQGLGGMGDAAAARGVLAALELGVAEGVEVARGGRGVLCTEPLAQCTLLVASSVTTGAPLLSSSMLEMLLLLLMPRFCRPMLG